ncbi:MAG TPA: propionate/acetate kinase, partial [Enterobacteriaceae bacterium]|nr:propionate/acetate kinase [Enterobacteriaceae bacterium]
RHIGGHVAALKRFDALIFTGGIGENSALIRELTVKRLQALGLTLDDERNQQLFGGRSGIISGTGATKIAVIPTNEEKMIAMDAAAIACTA